MTWSTTNKKRSSNAGGLIQKLRSVISGLVSLAFHLRQKSKKKWGVFTKKARICKKCLSHTAHALVMLLLFSPAVAKADMSPVMVDQIVHAIYRAEGGQSAKKPYGILSVSCTSSEDCRRICANTVRNNYRRWMATDQSQTFLEFLASRYAPVSAKNDPKKLNRNWLKNVQFFLFGGGK